MGPELFDPHTVTGHQVECAGNTVCYDTGPILGTGDTPGNLYLFNWGERERKLMKDQSGEVDDCLLSLKTIINIMYDNKICIAFVFSLYYFIVVDINCESSKGGSKPKQMIDR